MDGRAAAQLGDQAGLGRKAPVDEVADDVEPISTAGLGGCGVRGVGHAHLEQWVHASMIARAPAAGGRHARVSPAPGPPT